MTKKLNIPMWGYALIVLLGPVFVFGLIILVGRAVDLLFDLLGRFPYWWAVFIAIGYLLLGIVIAGLVSTLEANNNE